MEKGSSDEAFDFSQVISSASAGLEAVLKDKTVQKRKEKRQQEEKERQRELARQKRQAKKQQREKNKKRKRGEEVSSDEDEDENKNADGATKKAKTAQSTQRTSSNRPREGEKYGVWVGNFAFSTMKNTIREYFGQCGEITRFACPDGSRAGQYNRGYCFVFYDSPDAVEKALALSEKELDGRALLVKDASDYQRKDGTVLDPKAKKSRKSANPPCATLFLGNLPHKTTKDSLKAHFEQFGALYDIRVATFQDNPDVCKGFAYADYKHLDDAKKAFEESGSFYLDGKRVRVEYGSEDAYRRGRPWISRGEKEPAPEKPSKRRDLVVKDNQKDTSEVEHAPQEVKRRTRTKDHTRNKRVAPGKALSDAPRAKTSIQEFSGSKITFD
ncbi:hypothetical protein BCR43DRAFT_562486 [Syncephalastrum racemosum]|uniref:RRM domain-containing protein n=1 Tax=Syncephalastrum racemosum TaxID=13706 RepID=A0A1X2HJ94_SYNRA|nr:hypothetical protein BCR43DRAFT_562486 [Syncephalastrum racemosum]